METTNVASPAGIDLTITREIDAPRGLVYDAWTDGRHLSAWSAPHGFTITHGHADVSAGGAWTVTMQSPDGTEHRAGGVYREVVPGERLVLTHGWLEDDGRADHQTLVTVTFDRVGTDRTRMTFRQAGFRSVESRDGHADGWAQSFERLAILLRQLSERENPAPAAADNEWVAVRRFDAPKALVYRAWTEPALMAQWWGPTCFTNPVCELDVRPGGGFRIVMRGPDGTDYPFKGKYVKVVSPERLVYTNDTSEHPDEWHDRVNPGRPTGAPRRTPEPVTSVTFDELDGRTTQTVRMTFESAALRDSFLKIGMAEGWAQSFEKLTKLLAAEQQSA